MEVLDSHERFEMEVLEKLAHAGYFRFLVFGGGTMLRLCHELPRYSVDLDFWFSRKMDYAVFYKKLKDFLSKDYELTDTCNKHYTLLYELRSTRSERRLKIEIRKEVIAKGIESKIAFSKGASIQVLVKTLSLEESAKRKKMAVISRNEIRDYFDLEFMLKKIDFDFSEKEKDRMFEQIKNFKKEDYSMSLGSLLSKDLRDYYKQNQFSYLLEKLKK